jgi:hypothetical protein
MSSDLVRFLSWEVAPVNSECSGKVIVGAGVSESTILAILNPDWEREDKEYGWADHIPGNLRSLWNELSAEARLAAFAVAIEAARREDAMSIRDSWK